MNESFNGVLPQNLASQAIATYAEDLSMRLSGNHDEVTLVSKIGDAITKEWGYSISDPLTASSFEQFVNQVHWRLYHSRMQRYGEEDELMGQDIVKQQCGRIAMQAEIGLSK